MGFINASFGKSNNTGTQVLKTLTKNLKKKKKTTKENDKNYTIFVYYTPNVRKTRKRDEIKINTHFPTTGYSTVSGRPASELLRGCAHRGPNNESVQFGQHNNLPPFYNIDYNVRNDFKSLWQQQALRCGAYNYYIIRPPPIRIIK